MPRGPKIPPATRREWLEAYDRGERIDKIARDAGRTERTIKEHIKRARQEREQREVRAGLLREAYQRHYEDLLDVAKRLQEAAQMPSPNGLLPIVDRRTQMLVDALRSHIPDSRLWRVWKEWEDRAQRMDAAAVETKARLAKAVDRTFAEAGTGVSRDWLIESLWAAITKAARGESLDGMEYRIESTAEGPSLRWGAYGLSAAGVDETALRVLQDHHQQLVQEVTAREDYVGNVRDALRRWAKARDDIDQEIEILLLRRLLPGQCNLCPQ